MPGQPADGRGALSIAPGPCQTRGCELDTPDRLRIRHNAIPLKVWVPGKIRTGPSAASAAGAGAKNMKRQERLREPLPPTGTDPPIHRTSSAANMGQDIL